MVTRVLIANRGEIALRILRACRALALPAVVAYSEADRESLPVQLADEAICIGPADARRSYLSAPAVISAAIVTGCDAIHPGYGFLSEDAGFADAVRAHDLTFIGPSPEVLERFASKEATRRLLGPLRPAHDPGLGRHAARRPARARRGRADRLPGAHQAVGRRRRQGHADGPLAARARGGAPGLPLRGAGRVRRRLALPRALARGEPPRRGPGRGGPLRPRRPPRRARLLRPAPPPEDHRGGPDAGARPRPPGPSSPSGRCEPCRGRLREPRHARVPRRRGRQRLLHRDQLPDPGGAPGDGDAQRHRPRRDPDPDRRRRAAGVQPVGRLAPRPRHRVPHQRRGRRRTTSGPRRARVEAYLPPGGPGVRMDSHLYSGLRGAALLRFAARQADRLGCRPRPGDRPVARRARRGRRRRHRDEPADPPGAPRRARPSSRAG